MEEQSPVRIAAEIQQLSAQYTQEVPSRRRTWPKSIKDRVLQLLEWEISCESVAKQTGIPAATIYAWKAADRQSRTPYPPSQSFMPMKVVTGPTGVPQASTPARVKSEPGRQKRKRSVATIVVITPSGIRFEGLDISSALRIAARLGLGQAGSS